MEKVVGQEERIKRAEEVYNRRREQYENGAYKERYYKKAETNVHKSFKSRITKKLLIQICLCAVIYICIYVMQNSNEVFSENVRSKTNEFLSYDMNFMEIYNSCCSFFSENGWFNGFLGNGNSEDSNKLNVENNDLNIENSNSEISESWKIDSNEISLEGAIGGSDEVLAINEEKQYEDDASYIKQNYNIIWPLTGIITSKYGTRTATQIVTANHYGIDIAGNIGDSVISAMDGIVTLVSEEGDYGKHVKIECGDVATLYAHCNTLCVNQGSTIKQGDKIAEVGQTGRATRSASTF